MSGFRLRAETAKSAASSEANVPRNAVSHIYCMVSSMAVGSMSRSNCCFKSVRNLSGFSIEENEACMISICCPNHAGLMYW